MPIIERPLESPYTALCAAAVFGAIALSGKFNVTATPFLLVLAWAIGVIGLCANASPAMIGGGAILAGGLIVLG